MGEDVSVTEHLEDDVEDERDNCQVGIPQRQKLLTAPSRLPG